MKHVLSYITLTSRMGLLLSGWSFTIVVSVFDARDGTQDPKHAKQAFHHWATPCAHGGHFTVLVYIQYYIFGADFRQRVYLYHRPAQGKQVVLLAGTVGECVGGVQWEEKQSWIPAGNLDFILEAVGSHWRFCSVFSWQGLHVHYAIRARFSTMLDSLPPVAGRVKIYFSYNDSHL